MARKAFQIDWFEFTNWVNKKYAITYAHTIMTYTKRYNHILFGNLRELDTIPVTIRNNTIKALIVLAKFLGIHQKFKDRLKDYGVKLYRPDAFASFLRIYGNQATDLVK